MQKCEVTEWIAINFEQFQVIVGFGHIVCIFETDKVFQFSQAMLQKYIGNSAILKWYRDFSQVNDKRHCNLMT